MRGRTTGDSKPDPVSDGILQVLAIWKAKGRKYRAWLDQHGKTERGIFDAFSDAYQEMHWHYPCLGAKRPKQDPPDFLGVTQAGDPVGVEITELVSRLAIEENHRRHYIVEKSGPQLSEPGNPIQEQQHNFSLPPPDGLSEVGRELFIKRPCMAEYTTQDGIAAFAALLEKKGGQSAMWDCAADVRKILVIGTSEMSLCDVEFLDVLSEHVFVRPGTIDEAWALFYRGPGDNRRQLVRLNW